MNKNLIIYIALIFTISAIAFLSQQPYAHDFFKNLSANINKYAGATLIGGLNFKSPNTLNNNDNNDSTDTNTNTDTDSSKLIDSSNSAGTNTLQGIDFTAPDKEKLVIPIISEIPQKVMGAIKSGGEIITNSINNTKENISAAEKNIVNYFSGISDAIQGKENISTNNQCPTE